MDKPRVPVRAYLLFLILAFVVATGVAAEVTARVARWRAEQQFHGLRGLQVGKASFAEARAFIVGQGGGVSPLDHSGCSPRHCTFELLLEHYPFFMKNWGLSSLSNESSGQVTRVFPAFGLEDWQTQAMVLVNGGVVTQVSYHVFVQGRGNLVLGRFMDEFMAVPQYLEAVMGERHYQVNWFKISEVKGGEGIQSAVTPQASAEEISHAFDFDFGCLTRLGGCTSICEAAPASFADLLQQTHEAPWLDEHDPHCAMFKSVAKDLNETHSP